MGVCQYGYQCDKCIFLVKGEKREGCIQGHIIVIYKEEE